jgi:hypothetical protein
MKMSSMRYVFLDVTASGRRFAELYHSANHENREALKQYVSWLSPADGSTTYASIARVIVNVLGEDVSLQNHLTHRERRSCKRKTNIETCYTDPAQNPKRRMGF